MQTSCVNVLIKANPPAMLSTVQYVDAFYGNRLQGEDQYWWMQVRRKYVQGLAKR